MSENGRTALAILVPAATGLLESVAERFAGVVREGVPPHVSVQYPFVPVDMIDDGAIAELADVFGAQAAMPVTFSACRRLDGFVYLRPEPAEWLVRLTAQVRRCWPEVVSPKWAARDVGPHLTVAMHASEQAARSIEEMAGAALPISTQMREVFLLVFDERWTVRQRFVFGADR